ncbi:MAG: hypothetical protein U9Q20_08050 [Campylobacterota bacterium]|nr:hypothetical protein [Campylobacterota bacterium]
MDFLKPKDKNELTKVVSNLYIKQFQELYHFIEEILDSILIMGLPKFVVEKTALYNVRHHEFATLFVLLFSNETFKKKLYEKLTSTKVSKELYKILIWEEKDYITSKAINTISLNVKPYNLGNMGHKREKLENILSFITRLAYKDFRSDVDKLFIENELRGLLKYCFTIPNDFHIQKIESLESCDYEYSNEQGVFTFISTIEEMLQNNLVDFGKTNEKPLVKTLNLLKSSSSVLEFFNDDKKSNTIVTDMLTRSFYFYYFSQKRFRENPLVTLKDLITKEFDTQLPFFISRIFTSHLKKVRFDEYYTSENELFEIVKYILNQMPKDGWIDFSNIIRYCKYRDIRFNFESNHKTDDYYMKCDILQNNINITDEVDASSQYDIIFFEPVLKAVFFYLGGLGILELKYDKPTSPYTIKAKDLPYISVWDQLKYIKLTNLGLYTLGLKDSYQIKTINNKTQPKLKFDEYKPIITVDIKDAIMLAKIEPYTDKYDENRYILSYSKIFKDCKTTKSLSLKIDGFYNNIEKNPPKVFDQFFEEIKENTNMLKRDLKQIVINLENNTKLLNLFMTNKRLQELTIKAQGYRVIISKDDISKLTKIVKDHGFFIEF